MAQISGLESSICLVWKMRRPSPEGPGYSSNFSLLGLKWNLEMKCNYVFKKGVYYTVRLQQGIREGNLNPRLWFHITTYVEDSSNYSGDVLNNVTDVTKANQIIWNFNEDDVFEAIPSFKNNEEFRVVCVIRDVPPSAFQIRNETIHLSTQTDVGLHLTSAQDSINLSIGKSSSDKYVQVSEKIRPKSASTSSNFLEPSSYISFIRSNLGQTSGQSEVFATTFRSRLRESETSDVSGLESLISNLLENINSSEFTSSLYAIGHVHDMQPFTKVCYDWMTRNLVESNCFNFLSVADALNDVDLKTLVISFIFHHSEMLTSDDWLVFSQQNPKLANEVYHGFVTSTIRQQNWQTRYGQDFRMNTQN